MAKSNIHLIRHGMTEGNVKRWYYGSKDVPLLPEGVAELKRLVASGIYPPADEDGRMAAAELYTSGLLRTEQTFYEIYGDREHRHLDALKELCFGDYEGFTHEELAESPVYREWISDKSGKTGPPGGESPMIFYERIRGGFDSLLKNHEALELSAREKGKEAHTIVVCHGGVISAVMQYQFASEDKNLYQWIPDPGHGYSLSIEDGKAVSHIRF